MLPCEKAAKIRREKPIQWVHVHKSSGWLMCQLAQCGGETVVTPNKVCNLQPYDDNLSGRNKPHKALNCQTRVMLVGNATWGAIERELYATDGCYTEFEYGIVLREPLARMISMLNAHHDEITPDQIISELRNPTVIKISDYWTKFDNFLLRTLVPGVMYLPPGTIGGAHLAAAKDVLKNFTYVQRLEDLPRNGALFVKSLGWPSSVAHLVTTKVHVTQQHDRYFRTEDEAWLRRLNAPEFALYEWAATLQAGTFEGNSLTNFEGNSVTKFWDNHAFSVNHAFHSSLIVNLPVWLAAAMIVGWCRRCRVC
eukprot:NODE_1264_length_1189_cov_339.536155.p1 GENE.NODE_1264_length_1189_cov_339.536155~~NODE_1264_length_1189_cov_339.536155.p1  ORF type:complete len:352 (+),score=57.32 NODE_1264_length_1189_cov_339.536155:128-1057(+)